MDHYTLLIQKLSSFKKKYYLNLLLRGAIYTVALIFLFYLIAVTLQYLGEFSVPVRTGLFWGWILINSLILVRFILIPLLHLYRIGKIITDEEAAKIIGSHFREVKDRLLNVLQLKNSMPGANNPETAVLIEASIEQKLRQLKLVPFASAIDLRDNRKYVKYIIFPSLVFLALLFSSPGIISDGTARLIRYNIRFEKRMPFQFAILNHDMTVPAHDDFELQVEITGSELPDEVYIVETNNRQSRMVKKSKSVFRHRFSNVHKSTRFHLFASGFSSDEFEITVLPKPVILAFTVNLSYPLYTGKKQETRENTGDLVIPSGTKASWKFSTENATSVHMLFSDSSLYLHTGDNNECTYVRTLLKNQAYRVTTSNRVLAGRDTMLFAINVIPDMYPSISSEEIPDSLSAKQIYFTGLVKDDYGLSMLTFNYKVQSGNGETGKTGSQQTIQLPLKKGSIHDTYFYVWDLTEMEMAPGQQIEYYFEVWDNDAVNGNKSSRTPTHIFRAPTLEEIAERTSGKNESIKNMISDGVKKARDIQRGLEELGRRMMDKKNPTWEEKKKLENLMEMHNELRQDIEHIRKQNSINFSQEEEFMQFSEEMMEKRQELEELFEKIMTDEMKELLMELEKTMDQLDKSKLKEMMDKMELSSKDIEKELDRNLELFKQLEVEQKLMEAIDQLNKLADEEEKLSEKAIDKNARMDSLKSAQDDLNRQFENLRKNMDDLEKKNKELEYPNKIENTEADEQSIEQDMQNSSQQLGSQNRKKASGSQKSASGKMKEMSQKLQNSLAEMNTPSEDMETLRQILENLVKLSFDQEALMQELATAKTSDPKYIQFMQEQRKLKDDSKIIEDSLLALSKRVMQIEPLINREISAMNMNMDKSIQGLVARNIPDARQRQQFTMTAANNLALLLSETLQQMQQQMSSQMSGSGSCSKPGNSRGKGKPSMSTLKKLQDDLNKQLEKMKKGMKPGGEGSMGMSEELARMAAKQEFIRNQLRKIMDQENPLGKIYGNVQNLMKMMEQNETDIVNKQITSETLMRQQEIMTRLLEAEKAIREREYDNQRQAEEAKNYEQRNLFQQIQYKYRKSNEEELLKTVHPSLNPYYKHKVREYFNNLN